MTRRRVPTMLEEVSHALQRQSLPLLKASLVRSLRSDIGHPDSRDVIIGLGPYYDCARRLGADVSQFFDEAASGLPDDVGNLARWFGRTDMDPSVELFRVVESPRGPVYEWSDRDTWKSRT